MSVRLGPEELETVRRLGIQRRLRGGQILFREGERADAVFVVTAGSVRVVVHTDHGEERTLAAFGAGELVGELGVLDGAPRSATAIVDRAGTAIVLQASAFEATLLEHPALAVGLVRAMGSRLRETSVQLADQQSGSVSERVVKRLIAMIDEADLGGPVTLRATRADLASWIGASRETVSRALGELREEGLVELGRGTVRVVDPEALRRRV